MSASTMLAIQLAYYNNTEQQLQLSHAYIYDASLTIYEAI